MLMVATKRRPISYLSLCLLAGGLFTSSNLFAQSSVDEPEIEVDERVVITATSSVRRWQDTPAAVDIVATDQQLPGLRIDAAELLQGIPGLQADSRGNYAQDTRIVMRGFGARSSFGVRDILLSLDGIPLAMPDGQAQTSSIFLDEPEYVEVLRGPLAGLYGNGAGGVIDMRSRTPTESQLQASLLAGADDTSRWLLQGDWVHADGHAVRVAAAQLRTDGPRAHNRAERDQLALRGYLQLAADTRLVVRLDDNDAPLLEDPSALSPSAWREDPTQTFAGAIRFNTRKTIRHRQASLSLDHTPTQRAHWQVNAWQGKREVLQYLPFPGDEPTSSGAVIDLSREFEGVNLRYQLPLTASLRASAGLEYEEQTDNRLGFANNFGEKGEMRRDEVGTVRSQDAYGMLEWQATERLQWIAGARYSDLSFAVADNYINAFSPDDSGGFNEHDWAWALAANYELSNDFTAFVAHGISFAAPTLTELAYRNQGSGLNTDLQPSNSRQTDVGVKYQPRAGDQLGLTLFNIDTSDTLVVDQSNDGRTTYRNAGTTERYGLELALEWQLTDNLSSRGSLTWMAANFGANQPAAIAEQRLPGVAEQQAYLQLDYAVPFAADTTASLVLDYRGDVAADDENSVLAPARTIMSLALQRSWVQGAWQFSPWLRVDNLTDKVYVGSVVVNQGSGRSFEPGVGRTWSAGVQITHRL